RIASNEVSRPISSAGMPISNSSSTTDSSTTAFTESHPGVVSTAAAGSCPAGISGNTTAKHWTSRVRVSDTVGGFHFMEEGRATGGERRLGQDHAWRKLRPGDLLEKGAQRPVAFGLL